MNRSTPGLPVHHQLAEFIQTHVHLEILSSQAIEAYLGEFAHYFTRM